ncbi:MAG TPA: YeeE/YedE thiosulfate transporter family protein [Gemmatimonadaceae bacterium]|nr:YeeE/YedE thiosulfate transporter family protein [Gemmatimonadaceae bacterium]
MYELLAQPWPWWVGGPILGLVAAALLYVGNKSLGVSSSFRHVCAAVAPGRNAFLRYDWRSVGGWNLAFAAGLLLGGAIAVHVLGVPMPDIDPGVRQTLAAQGVRDFSGLLPGDVFSIESLLSVRGLTIVVLGGFLIGFGSAYAGGCTSGHGITGLAALEWRSALAVVAFLVGGAFTAFVILPVVLSR